jgi:hypothetical protein
MGLMEDFIHGLSQVEFHLGPGRDLLAWSNAAQRDRDHVAILDGLTLLFVFTSRRGVAAVSYWQSAEGIKLLWAKNQPVDDSNQLRYIKDLFENITNGAKESELLHIVIAMCREKIFHRVRKLAGSFGVCQNDRRRGESNLWQFDGTKKPHQKLEAALREAGWLENKSTTQVLGGFMRFVGGVTKTSESKVFLNVLYFSWTVTSVVDFDKMLEEQVRHLRKLGDYVRVIRYIPLLLKKLGNAKITIEQVLT